MFAASKTAAAAAGTPPASTDPQFNYVTMLLHGDGTNGAQNNTFVDSSTNNFTITRNGTPTQGTFSPYGTLWSNYFGGSGSFIQASGSQNQNLLGNGDFTIEAWVFSSTSAFNQTIVTTTSLATGARGFGWNLRFEGGYNIRFYVGSGTSGSDNEFLLATSTGITINTWNHIAVVRKGATVYVYVNGVQKGSAAMPATYNLTGTVPCQIGQRGTSLTEPIIGNISNCRIVAGTALYTSNFTPSTTPLTAVSGTSLLTCQSNRFRDASSNNFAITVTGTPSVQRFSPFDPAAEYSTSVIGGSGYFGGSSQYLSATSNSSLDISTEDFTVEFFVNPASITTGVVVGFTNGAFISSATQLAFAIYFSGSSLIVRVYYGASFSAIATVSVPVSAWTHIALVRSGNVFTVYRNGVSAGTATLAITLNYGSGWKVGVGSFVGDSQNGYLNGYVSDLRIVKGTAVYTANFTPPTAPLTAITNTSLLLNCVNAGIYDNAMMNDLVTVGNAQVSTAVKKYGTGSMAFDGSGDYLSTPTSENMNFGTGDFTVEAWVYPTSLSSDWFISSASGSGGLFFGFSSTTIVGYGWGRAGVAWDYRVASTATVNTWQHVAVTRNGTSMRLFVNGVQQGTTQTISTAYNMGTTSTTIGSQGANYYLTGYIDDLRITKGIARYTANFTPPTAAFPNN